MVIGAALAYHCWRDAANMVRPMLVVAVVVAHWLVRRMAVLVLVLLMIVMIWQAAAAAQLAGPVVQRQEAMLPLAPVVEPVQACAVLLVMVVDVVVVVAVYIVVVVVAVVRQVVAVMVRGRAGNLFRVLGHAFGLVGRQNFAWHKANCIVLRQTNHTRPILAGPVR